MEKTPNWLDPEVYGLYLAERRRGSSATKPSLRLRQMVDWNVAEAFCDRFGDTGEKLMELVDDAWIDSGTAIGCRRKVQSDMPIAPSMDLAAIGRFLKRADFKLSSAAASIPESPSPQAVEAATERLAKQDAKIEELYAASAIPDGADRPDPVEEAGECDFCGREVGPLDPECPSCHLSTGQGPGPNQSKGKVVALKDLPLKAVQAERWSAAIQHCQAVVDTFSGSPDELEAPEEWVDTTADYCSEFGWDSPSEMALQIDQRYANRDTPLRASHLAAVSTAMGQALHHCEIRIASFDEDVPTTWVPDQGAAYEFQVVSVQRKNVVGEAGVVIALDVSNSDGAFARVKQFVRLQDSLLRDLGLRSANPDDDTKVSPGGVMMSPWLVLGRIGRARFGPARNGLGKALSTPSVALCIMRQPEEVS